MRVIIKNFGINTGSNARFVYWTGTKWSANRIEAQRGIMPDVEPGLVATPEDSIGPVAGIAGAIFECE